MGLDDIWGASSEKEAAEQTSKAEAAEIVEPEEFSRPQAHSTLGAQAGVRGHMQLVARAQRRMQRAYKPFTTSAHPLAVTHSPFSCAVCKTTKNLLTCSACKCVRFCSRDHQRQFNARHQVVCKFLASCRGGLLQDVSGKDWHAEGFRRTVEVFIKHLEDREPTSFEYEQLLHIPRCKMCGKLPATLACARSHAVGYCSDACWASDREWRSTWQCQQAAYTQAAAHVMHKAGGGIPVHIENPEGALPDEVYDGGWKRYIAHCNPSVHGQPFMSLPPLTQHILIDQLSYPMAALEALHRAGRCLEELCDGLDHLEVHMLLPESAAQADMEKYVEWLCRAGPQVKALTIQIIGHNLTLGGMTGSHGYEDFTKSMQEELVVRGCTMGIYHHRMPCHVWLDKVSEAKHRKRRCQLRGELPEPRPKIDKNIFDGVGDPAFRICYSPMFDSQSMGAAQDVWGPVLERLAATEDGAPLVVTESSFCQLARDKTYAEQRGLMTISEPQTSNFTSCLALPDDTNNKEDNELGLLVWNMGHAVFQKRSPAQQSDSSMAAAEDAAQVQEVQISSVPANSQDDDQEFQADLIAGAERSEGEAVSENFVVAGVDASNSPAAHTMGEILLSMPGPWSFDGTGCEDVAYTLDANPESSFCVEMYAMSTGGKGFRSPLTARDETPYAGYMFYIDANDNWAFWIGDRACEYNWTKIVGPLATTGVWTHLLAVLDMKTSQASFYVDGKLAGLHSDMRFVPNRCRPLRIGAGRTERARPLFCFTGEVKDIVVHSLSEGSMRPGIQAASSAQHPTQDAEEERNDMVVRTEHFWIGTPAVSPTPASPPPEAAVGSSTGMMALVHWDVQEAAAISLSDMLSLDWTRGGGVSSRAEE